MLYITPIKQIISESSNLENYLGKSKNVDGGNEMNNLIFFNPYRFVRINIIRYWIKIKL